MTPELLARLKKAIEKSGDTSFIQADEKFYVRYNSILIRTKLKDKSYFGLWPYEKNLFIIELKLDGETVYTKELETPITFEKGDVLDLKAIQGVFAIEIT